MINEDDWLEHEYSMLAGLPNSISAASDGYRRLNRILGLNRRQRRLKCQQARLKGNQARQALSELKAHPESSEVDEDSAPVRKAYRY